MRPIDFLEAASREQEPLRSNVFSIYDSFREHRDDARFFQEVRDVAGEDWPSPEWYAGVEAMHTLLELVDPRAPHEPTAEERGRA